MSKEGYDVFISYASPDRDVAREIAVELKGRGLNAWFDEWQLLPGHRLDEQLDDAMRASRVAVVLLSAASQRSSWVSREWESALRNSWERSDFAVLPVVLDEGIEVPSFLRAWQQVHAHGDREEDLASQLADWVQRGRPQRADDESTSADAETRIKQLLAAIGEIASEEEAAR